MNLIDILMIKFPNADFTKDILVQDDGSGPYIAKWNLVGVKEPSLSDVTAWQNDSANIAAYNTNQANIKNKVILDQLRELDLRSIRALRTSDTTLLTSLEAQAMILRTQLVK